MEKCKAELQSALPVSGSPRNLHVLEPMARAYASEIALGSALRELEAEIANTTHEVPQPPRNANRSADDSAACNVPPPGRTCVARCHSGLLIHTRSWCPAPERGRQAVDESCGAPAHRANVSCAVHSAQAEGQAKRTASFVVRAFGSLEQILDYTLTHCHSVCARLVACAWEHTYLYICALKFSLVRRPSRCCSGM